MGRKRKRSLYKPQDDDNCYSPTSHELEEPAVDGAHLYRLRHELPWDISRCVARQAEQNLIVV